MSSGRTRREASYGAESNKLVGKTVSSSRRFLKTEFDILTKITFLLLFFLADFALFASPLSILA